MAWDGTPFAGLGMVCSQIAKFHMFRPEESARPLGQGGLGAKVCEQKQFSG